MKQGNAGERYLSEAGGECAAEEDSGEGGGLRHAPSLSPAAAAPLRLRWWGLVGDEEESESVGSR